MEGTSQAVLGSSSRREGTGQPVDFFFSFSFLFFLFFFLPLSFRFKIFFILGRVEPVVGKEVGLLVNQRQGWKIKIDGKGKGMEICFGEVMFHPH
jgi:hypothetical protein